MSADKAIGNQNVSKEIWQVSTGLSKEIQDAAVRKAEETGLDTNKGRLSLEETFINLSSIRDLLIAAYDSRKLDQLPLKIQRKLLAQLQVANTQVSALISGSDTVLSLEDSVEDLMESVWTYGLRNLSDHLLGYETKMNELKNQEVLIRKVHRSAAKFETDRNTAERLMTEIASAKEQAQDHLNSIDVATKIVPTLLANLTRTENEAAAILAQLEKQDESATRYASSAKIGAADVEALLTKAKLLQSESDSAHASFISTTSEVTDLLAGTGERIDEQIVKLSKSLEDQLAKREADIASKLDEQIETHTETISKGHTEGKGAIEAFKSESQESLKGANAEHTRLVQQLDELEGRIRDAIERATGYSLFHAFQTRQLDIARSKVFWAWMLAVTVVVSLLVSGILIWKLSSETTFNAMFYLKLSISLPLIYAIAFCSVQYSRERRLEEEYAFKSSISVSLDPYRELVEKLIGKDDKVELGKYTEFIIGSVNRVFTSPTAHVFDDDSRDKNAAEKTIKALGDVLDPIIKLIGRK